MKREILRGCLAPKIWILRVNVCSIHRNKLHADVLHRRGLGRTPYRPLKIEKSRFVYIWKRTKGSYRKLQSFLVPMYTCSDRHLVVVGSLCVIDLDLRYCYQR